MRKINIVILLLISITTIKAQVNYFELSNKLMYFGISMGFTGGDYKLIPAPTISRKDSIYNFKTIVQPGFNLGIIGNLQVHKYFDIRLIPSLVFTDRRIQYAMNDGTKINKFKHSLDCTLHANLVAIQQFNAYSKFKAKS
jgi:hypothetical protein